MFMSVWRASSFASGSVAASEQFGDVGVPAGGVKVGDALLRLVRNAGTCEVPLDHLPCLLLFQVGKEFLRRPELRQPFAKEPNQIRMQWQHVFAAVLGAGRVNGDGWRLGVEFEAPRREACEFRPAKPREIRHHVKPGSELAAVGFNTLLAGPSGVDELHNLLGLQS